MHPGDWGSITSPNKSIIGIPLPFTFSIWAPLKIINNFKIILISIASVYVANPMGHLAIRAFAQSIPGSSHKVG
jgi:hypothetical protein